MELLDAKQLKYSPSLTTVEQPLPGSVMVLNTNGQRSLPLSLKSQLYSCPNCGKQMMTCVKRRPNKYTHAFAFLFCITGLFFLAPLPYCMSTCTSPDHFCSVCDQFVGRGAS